MNRRTAIKTISGTVSAMIAPTVATQAGAPKGNIDTYQNLFDQDAAICEDTALCLEGRGDYDPAAGAVFRPIYANVSYSGKGYGYFRDGHPNEDFLERALAKLERGEKCVAFSSGCAAINTAMFILLNRGDHILCSNPCYISVWQFIKGHLCERYGVEVDFFDPADPDSLHGLLRENTRLVHLETPANPLTLVADVEKIAAIAHSAGAILTVDSTWASPVLLKPLLLGADLVFHSLTKYINGHGDAGGGAVIGRADLVDNIRREGLVRLGACISPFNAWLIGRGMATLPLRMKRISETAMTVAKYLESHKMVERIYYPGLESHPQHEVAKRQMKAFSGMINFRLKDADTTHGKFVNKLKIFRRVVSLGHAESLLVASDYGGNDIMSKIIRHTTKDYGQYAIRVSIGLEEPQRLIDDLEQALSGD
ncbi:MAG: aminotransferase class I/II-fold pyridoxal phosphate-dependent enzyme [Prevotellaceae bacterium]|jgi:cystathionine gamma-synthase/methionine-gamma-lyase|nr:aminotransferase class I/II-fold pyridoxal phosphate-dependent enzyme [Prevotellaceae bacterium]